MSFRVLFITNLFPIEENPTSGIFIVKRLQQYKKFGVSYTAVSIGFEVDFILRFLRKILKKPEKIPLKTYQNVQFLPIVIKRNVFKVFKNKIFPEYYKKLVKKYVEEISLKVDVNSYDVVHAHGMYHIPAGMIAEKIAERYNKPFLITVHGSDINLLMSKRKKEYIKTFEKANKVIFVSKALLEKAKSLGYSGKNAVVIPNGYDPEIFYPIDKEKVRRDLGIFKENYKYVGFIGNLIPIKRADKLPDIFHYIVEEIPNVCFIVVGDGYLREEIEEKTKDLDIVFTGRISQEKVAKYMNAMDVMVLPSRNEGWPCVVLEAQACGTCVVGSSSGGIPEAIGFEEYVVKEGENFEERFARKVVDVLKKGYDRNRLIERAKGFTWEEIVKREIKIYSLIRGKNKK